MGVIDAGTNLWLENVPTGSNAHSIAVDPSTNHAFVPLQAGPTCGTKDPTAVLASTPAVMPARDNRKPGSYRDGLRFR